MSLIRTPRPTPLRATNGPPVAQQRRNLAWTNRFLNGAIIGLWFWLYRPLYPYLAIIFSDQVFRTNQMILLIVVGLIVLQLRRDTLNLHLHKRPQLAWLPLTLALGGSLLYLGIERFLDLNIVATSLFFLASYGLLGLWMAPDRWREGLPAALLLMGALPFGEHMQTFVGYPMRIATANLVGDGFRAMGVGSIGLDTILTFENGIAHVDLPCSGVKSLWTGGLFLLAATWIERHPINLRWLLIAGLFSVLLFAGNFARVALLVGVGVVGQMALVAEMLHVPLGVLAFGVACGVVLWLLRKDPLRARRAPAPASEGGVEISLPGAGEGRGGVLLAQPTWLSPTLIACIGLLIVLYQPRPESGLTLAPPAWSFPPELTTIAEPLTADEIWWLTKDGAESADRRRFQWGEISGSMLLITSSTWRAHHRPERCFEVKGFAVDDLQTHLVGGEFPLRIVSLGQGNTHNTHSAVYWFQSSDAITEDYATRMWADLSPNRQRWVLVSLLFDENQPPDSADLTPFYQAIVAAINEGLKEAG